MAVDPKAIRRAMMVAKSIAASVSNMPLQRADGGNVEANDQEQWPHPVPKENMLKTHHAQRYGTGLPNNIVPENMFDRDENPGISHGTGPYLYALEHIGDLPHRLSYIDDVGGGVGYGIEAALDKTARNYDLRPERLNESLQRNYNFQKRENLFHGSYDDFVKKFEDAADRYAHAYRMIPVHTQLQELGRDAAIALGERDFYTARKNLNEIHRRLSGDNPEQEYWRPVKDLEASNSIAKNTARLERMRKADGGDVGENDVETDDDYLTVYHGTPHRFAPTERSELGEFDPTKIGTGAGNQSYGHGLYLSQNPDLAKTYRKNLGVSHGKWFDKTGKELAFSDLSREQKLALRHLQLNGGDVQKAESDIKMWEDATNQKDITSALHSLTKENLSFEPAKGALYTVGLRKKAADRMLDWHLPFSQQHPDVQKALQDAGIVGKDDWLISGMRGDEIYRRAQRGAPVQLPLRAVDDHKFAAQRLLEAGIPGIKYVDNTSRARHGGEPTHNFVVFPGAEHHLKIMKREKRGGLVTNDTQVPIQDSAKTVRRALMTARSVTPLHRAFGGRDVPSDEPHLSEIIKRGQPIEPSTPDPSNEELAAARADTRVGSDIVNQRLNKIVPESSRVVGGKYIPGAPGGGRWSDLPAHVLEAPGTGFNVHDHELQDLWRQSVSESSQAAKNAVEKHNIRPTFGAKDWDKAMRLPIKDRLWYELSGEKMAENMPELSAKEHMHHMDLVGATSARADPSENLERSLSVLSQSMRGVPVDVDLTQPSAVRQALSRKGFASSALPGNKTGHFSDTLTLTGGVPTRFPISVNDVWVGKMFGVPDDVMSQNQSLHEPMALYFNKIRDLYNERHGHEAPFVHQSWNFQAPAWVHLRDPEATVSSGDAYHQVWGSIIKKLTNAGVKGIDGQKITREALMDPKFADALRKTTPAYREAPKSTIEFGTKLTPTGKRARELYDLAVQRGDKVSQQEYLKALTSPMYASGRGKLHPWERLKKAITGDLTGASDITRIVSPTSEFPLDIGGTFEGDVSPNIRVPLKDMSDNQIAMFNALAGKPLNQAAMATSRINLVNQDSQPKEGDIRGHSIFVPTLDQIHPDDIRTFAKEVSANGHDLSYMRHPNGYQFDVLPNFSGDFPKGINERILGDIYRKTLKEKYPRAKVIPHDFSSVYTADSDYADIRNNLLKEIKNDFIRQARQSGLEESAARRLLSASGSGENIPARSKRSWDAYRARIDHLTAAEAQLKALAQQVEQNHSAFIPRAEKRMGLTSGQTSGQPLSISEPEKASGGAVDRALQVAHQAAALVGMIPRYGRR